MTLFCRKHESVDCLFQGHHHRNLPDSSALRHLFLENLIVVTIEDLSRLQTDRHLQGEQTVALNLVHTETFQLTTVIDKTESVAIGKRSGSSHRKGIPAYLFYLPYILTDSLWRIRREDIILPAMKEIIGISSVKRFLQVGSKGISTVPLGSTYITVGHPTDQLVQPFTIGRSDILDIGDILQPAFYLERGDAGLEQILQGIDATHIFQRQQMLVSNDRLSIGILQVELHPAELRAVATIGTT